MTDTDTGLDAHTAVQQVPDGDIARLMGWLAVRDPAAVLDAIDAMQTFDARPKDPS